LTKYYEVIWGIKLFRIIDAESREEAVEKACNLDPRTEGNYQEDSFEILDAVEGEYEGGAFLTIEEYDGIENKK